MKRYFLLFCRIFSFNIRAAMEYRLNFAVKLFHGPAYVGVLFLLLKIAYFHSQQLVGWNESEALILFGVYQSMFAVAMFSFMPGIRYYMWEGFRYGAFDSLMLKPANVQFLATFSRPEIQHLPLAIGIFLLTVYQMVQLHLITFSLPFVMFMVAFVLSFVVCYLYFLLSMSLGFYLTKASQVLEFLDKLTDNAQYPTPLFPETLQTLFFTIIPIAFMGYVPTGILLGKLGPEWLGYMCALVFFFLVANQLAWRRALKHYSSASS